VALIAGKDKTQVQQKRYRYTNKERKKEATVVVCATTVPDT
jgi:hypothetical protein